MSFVNSQSKFHCGNCDEIYSGNSPIDVFPSKNHIDCYSSKINNSSCTEIILQYSRPENSSDIGVINAGYQRWKLRGSRRRCLLTDPRSYYASISDEAFGGFAVGGGKIYSVSTPRNVALVGGSLNRIYACILNAHDMPVLIILMRTGLRGGSFFLLRAHIIFSGRSRRNRGWR